MLSRAIEYFKREMQVIAGLQHPNIVRFLDSGSDQRVASLKRTPKRFLRSLARVPLHHQ